MLIFTSLLAFYLAFNLGANDVANSMGTSVGSKAVTLKQALLIAGVLEFAGAVLFGQKVSATLATQIVNPQQFAQTPQVLLVGMVAVLIACGIWLNLATLLGLPVSSSHAVVGAIAGFGWVAVGSQAVDWQSIGKISLTWMVTPLVSGAIAALFYSQIQRWILTQPDPLQALQEWIPWLSTSLVGIFGIVVLPSFSQPMQAFVLEHFQLHLSSSILPIALGAIAAISLTLTTWQKLDRTISHSKTDDPPHLPPLTPHPFSPCEALFARFQLLSACCVAFAHGSNDVGNAVAPLAAIAFIHSTGTVPTATFQVPLWILLIGGSGIVAGLAVLGKRVISTIGESIIPLQPSGGFCAELATATTVLIASHLGFPISTSHALVGGVVGIGLTQTINSIQIGTLRNIGLAWLVTIPISAGLGALLFKLAIAGLPSFTEFLGG